MENIMCSLLVINGKKLAQHRRYRRVHDCREFSKERTLFIRSLLSINSQHLVGTITL